MKAFFKKYKVDIIVISLLLIASLIGVTTFVFVNNQSASIASIYSMNKLVHEIDLSKEKEEARYLIVEGKHGDVKISIQKNDIKIVESTCPNKSCILEGSAKVSKPIICAYNEVYIELHGEKIIDTELG